MERNAANRSSLPSASPSVSIDDRPSFEIGSRRTSQRYGRSNSFPYQRQQSGDVAETRTIELSRCGCAVELSLYLQTVSQSSRPIHVNAMNRCKETPLYIAVCQRNIQMVQTLLDNSADPSLELACGNTVVHVAADQSPPLFFHEFLDVLKDWSSRYQRINLGDLLSRPNIFGWSCLDVWLERSLQSSRGFRDDVATHLQMLVQQKLTGLGARSGLEQLSHVQSVPGPSYP